MVDIRGVRGAGARRHGGRRNHCWLHMGVTSASDASEDGFEMVDSAFELIVFEPCDILVTAGHSW